MRELTAKGLEDRQYVTKFLLDTEIEVLLAFTEIASRHKCILGMQILACLMGLSPLYQKFSQINPSEYKAIMNKINTINNDRKILNEYKNVQYKEKNRKKFYLIIHLILLTFSLFAYYVYIQDTNQRIIYLTENSDVLEAWNNTGNIFKTNITNQLDRSNEIEELNYQKKAKKFYDLVSKKKETFIIDSYSFMYINDPSENKPLYVGSLVTEKNNQNYITSPSGNSITVDKNYLELNPIKTIEPMNFSEERNEGTNYLIIPEKYTELENEIVKNYTYDLKGDWRTMVIL